MGKYTAEIRGLLSLGLSRKEIGAKLGCSQTTIHYAVNGKKYPSRTERKVIVIVDRERASKRHEESDFAYAWRPRPITVPAPNALPWVTRERLMAGR